MGAIQPLHILVVVLVVILLFGANKLPQLARSVGESARVFRKEVQQMKDENGNDIKPNTTGSHAAGTNSTGTNETIVAPAVDTENK